MEWWWWSMEWWWWWWSDDDKVFDNYGEVIRWWLYESDDKFATIIYLYIYIYITYIFILYNIEQNLDKTRELNRCEVSSITC